MLHTVAFSPEPRPRAVVLMCAFLFLVPVSPSAQAALGACGQPRSNGANPLASDALEVLNTATGAAACGNCSPCVCDVDSSGGVTAADALRVLRRAVGLASELECTCPAGPGCGLAGRDEDCLEKACAADLACDPTEYDFLAEKITAATCHVPCGVDADCAAGQQCSPSTIGFYTVQKDETGKPVTCSIGSVPSGCDEAAGFACALLSSGAQCAREISACGTRVPMADRTALDSVPAQMWCNSGQPVDLPGVGVIGGSRFCDRLDSLANPPLETACQRIDNAHPSSLGVCFARCERDDGSLTDCPAGMHCSSDRAASAFGTFLPDPKNILFGVKECTTAGDCGDARYRCEEYIGRKFCFRPFATCAFSVP